MNGLPKKEEKKESVRQAEPKEEEEEWEEEVTFSCAEVKALNTTYAEEWEADFAVNASSL